MYRLWNQPLILPDTNIRTPAVIWLILEVVQEETGNQPASNDDDADVVLRENGARSTGDDSSHSTGQTRSLSIINCYRRTVSAFNTTVYRSDDAGVIC